MTEDLPHPSTSPFSTQELTFDPKLGLIHTANIDPTHTHTPRAETSVLECSALLAALVGRRSGLPLASQCRRGSGHPTHICTLSGHPTHICTLSGHPTYMCPAAAILHACAPQRPSYIHVPRSCHPTYMCPAAAILHTCAPQRPSYIHAPRSG